MLYNNTFFSSDLYRLLDIYSSLILVCIILFICLAFRKLFLYSKNIHLSILSRIISGNKTFYNIALTKNKIDAAIFKFAMQIQV